MGCFNKAMLIVGAALCLNLSAYSQSISLKVSNVTIKEAMERLKEVSGYSFVFSSSDVDTQKRVTVDAKNAPIEDIIGRILQGQDGLSYEIQGKSIIVKKNVPPHFSKTRRKVSGKVVDKNGEPVIGASVREHDTSNGTVTDMDGNFELSVPEDAIIDVSYIGYREQRVKARQGKMLAVTLVEDSELLDEVVVVGYGSQKKVNLSGAVSMINVDEHLAGRSITSTSAALNGLIPGLMVQQSSAMAGNDGATLRIRGLGTVNNSAPLIVVDGIPDIELNRIDMNDIASISVLKDASSSAVYGSRAANGVILITTKKGKSGKMSVSYSGNFSIGKATNYYDFLDDYPRALTLHNLAATNGNSATNYKDGTIDEWMAKGMVDPVLYPNTDWWDVIFRTPFTQNHSISATGGSEKGSYYLSVGLLNQEGLMINNDFKRYSFRSNVEQQISKYIKVGLNAAGQWSDDSYPYEDGLLTYGNAASWDLIKSPAGILPKHPVTGEYGGAMAYGEDGLANNPLAKYEAFHNERERKDFNGLAYLEWKPLGFLQFRADYGLTYRNDFVKSWSMPTVLQNFQTGLPSYEMVSKNAGITDYTAERTKTILNLHAIYEQEILKGHNLRFQFIYSEEYWHERSQSSSRNDRFHPSLTEINGAGLTTQSTAGSSSSEGLRSVVAKLNYDVLDKYMLQALVRWDASSKFSKGHQWGVFPSVSAAWRFSEEDFFERLRPVVNDAKVRLSWGKIGNNSGVDRYYQKDTYNSYPYTFGDNVIAEGYAPYKLIDPNFTWESTAMTNVGLELSFLNSRLRTEIDFYSKLTTNMIRQGQVSRLLSGLNAPDRNIGEMRNRGMELTVSWRDQIGGLFYGIGVNYALNKNKLLKWNERLGRGATFIGYPYEMVYTYKAVGIVQSWEEVQNAPFQNEYLAPGDLLMEDINGDGVINSSDKVAMPGYMRYIPIHDFSLNLNAEWKGFDIAALFQGNAGRKNFWLDNFNNVNVLSSKYSFQRHHLNSWTLENRNASLPRLTTGSSGGYNQEQSTFWLYSCNYLRLKNLQIGYSFPKKLLKTFGIQSMRIHLSAENLLTITDWPGLDPEKLPKSGSETPYPLVKTYSLGINVTL